MAAEFVDFRLNVSTGQEALPLLYLKNMYVVFDVYK